MLHGKKTIVVAAAGAVAGLVLAAVAFAASPTKPPVSGAAAGHAASGRLSSIHLRACQARQSAIENRSVHLADLAHIIEQKFSDIAERVEQYYANTVLPARSTVTNYDALLTAVSAKKDAADAAIAAAQQHFSGFSCASDDPKQQLAQFRDDMQTAKQALKDYRTAIKNLIVAIHAVDQPSPQHTSSQTPAS